MKLYQLVLFFVLLFVFIVSMTYEGIKGTHAIIAECEAKGGISVHSQGYGYICVRKDSVL